MRRMSPQKHLRLSANRTVMNATITSNNNSISGCCREADDLICLKYELQYQPRIFLAEYPMNFHFHRGRFTSPNNQLSRNRPRGSGDNGGKSKNKNCIDYLTVKELLQLNFFSFCCCLWLVQVYLENLSLLLLTFHSFQKVWVGSYIQFIIDFVA